MSRSLQFGESAIAVPKEFPPRLHVLLAREAPVGLVIRRGPSRNVCFVGWDRKHDRFTLGQWMKGRIDEHRCDISPDGRHVIYFMSKGGKGYSAISRVPYLKALAPWQHPDHFNGGGVFVDNHTYWLDQGIGEETQSTDELKRSLSPEGGDVEEWVYPHDWRLQLGGWNRFVADGDNKNDRIVFFEKRTNTGWTLRKVIHSGHNAAGKKSTWESHELESFDGVRELPDWEWADIDGKRFVWAEHGKLFAAPTTAHGIDDPTELFDFSTLTFTPTRAPY